MQRFNAKPMDIWRCFCLVAGLFCWGATQAQNGSLLPGEAVRPFYARDLTPFSLIFGIPGVEGAWLTPIFRHEIALQADLTSQYLTKTTAQESLLIDLESYHGLLWYRYGWSQRLEIGWDVPLHGYSGGFLDSAILNYHDWFNLPQGGRNAAPMNALNIAYLRQNHPSVIVRRAQYGLGDIRFTLAASILQDQASRRALSLRTYLKLPTGDSGALMGSGAVDAAVGLYYQQRHLTTRRFWDWYFSLGVVALGPSELFAAIQQEQILYTGLGFGVQIFAGWRFKMQFDVHSPVLADSSIRLFNVSNGMLMTGLEWRVNKHTRWEWAVGEDLITRTTPDVSFYLRFNRSY